MTNAAAPIVDVSTDDVVFLMEAGYIYLNMGRYKEAKEIFEGVAEIRPDSDVPRVALGNVYHAQGKFLDAAKVHRETLRDIPKSARAHAGLAECLIFQKKTDQALEELKKVLEIEPDSDVAQYARTLIEAIDTKVFDALP
jgi:tetratricopeptide (TPR) repeat protein